MKSESFDIPIKLSMTKESLCSGIVIGSVFICTLANSAYGMVAPFLPLHYKELGISEWAIGLVFSMYSIAVMVGGSFMQKLISRIGRRKCISTGLILMSLAFFLFGY